VSGNLNTTDELARLLFDFPRRILLIIVKVRAGASHLARLFGLSARVSRSRVQTRSGVSGHWFWLTTAAKNPLLDH
jgi:hypothetical protein